MLYLGDYTSGVTVDFVWSTNAADGSSITRATNGTISVYKGNSTTQTTTGVTDTEDFDSLTGIHHCRIVTTDAFYATGNDYNVVLSAATIDGKTVNAVLATFSIQNRYNPTPPTAAAIADAVWDEDSNDHLSNSPDLTTGWLLYEAASTDTEAIAEAVWDAALSAHDDAGTTGEALGAIGEGLSPAALADAVWDEAISGHATAGTTGSVLSAASAGDYVGGSATAATNAKNFFTSTGYNAAASAIGTATTVTNHVLADLRKVGGATAGDYTAFVNMLKGAVVGTVVSGTNTTTVISTGLASTTNGFYIGKTLFVSGGALLGQGGRVVTAYDGATKRLTVSPALTAALSAGDTIVLIG